MNTTACSEKHSIDGKSLRLFRNHVKPCRQKYSSSAFQKFMITLRHPASTGGAYRDRHGRKAAGCGGREGAQRAVSAPTKASSRTTKSCGPDLPTLGSSLAVMICKAMEAIKPGTPGRARSSR